MHDSKFSTTATRGLLVSLALVAALVVSSPPAAASSPGVSAVSAGAEHTCALMASGGVKCWGYNWSGQLGDGTGGTGSISTTPVDVSGLSSGVTAISAGYLHTCALITSGGMKCWGDNWKGDLGDGTMTNRLTPVDVVDGSGGLLSGVRGISAGGYHTCALMTSGGVKCWGYNATGALGDGTATDRTTPVDVVDGSGPLSGVAAISTGLQHTCALMASGGVKCWGWNEYGQLGDSTWTNRTTPVDVVDGSGGLLNGVAAIAAGTYHTCALMTSSGVKCWGIGWYGALGDGTATDSNVPVDVFGLSAPPDTTPPTITGTRVTEANADGWNNTAVDVRFTCTDMDSGVDSISATGAATGVSATSPLDVSVTTEGTNQSVTGTCTDKAGNSAQATVSDIDVDKTKPVVSVTGPVNGATYALGSVPAASCSATDALSGVKTNATLSTIGGPVGSITATCSGAEDYAGNTNSASVAYKVTYNFNGFLSPVNSPPVVNTGKAGRTYPVKWQLKDAQGNYISALSAVTSVTYKSTTCGSFSNVPTDALETTATGGTSLRYDSTANQYVYNWATSGTGCYTLFATLADTTVHTAYFQLTK